MKSVLKIDCFGYTADGIMQAVTVLELKFVIHLRKAAFWRRLAA
jgi:hypothetical protein